MKTPNCHTPVHPASKPGTALGHQRCTCVHRREARAQSHRARQHLMLHRHSLFDATWRQPRQLVVPPAPETAIGVMCRVGRELDLIATHSMRGSIPELMHRNSPGFIMDLLPWPASKAGYKIPSTTLPPRRSTTAAGHMHRCGSLCNI